MQPYNQVLSSNQQVSFACDGDEYYVYSSTGAITIQTDKSSAIPHVASTGAGFEQPFGRITLTDTSGATNSVVIIVYNRGRGNVYRSPANG